MRVATDSMLADRYRLEKQVGSGGMGTVWQARDVLLGRAVAVKLVDSPASVQGRAEVRLRREARALGSLSHPQVARVYDLCETGGDLFIVMELVEGESLAARLARQRQLPPAEAARIAMLCADALAAAHLAGIVHRDVKPSNIMLTGRDLKIIDFGIAATLEPSDTTATAGLVGTVAYLAPERASGAMATPATDVYSLGVVLYQMLAGRLPFQGEESIAMLFAHATQPPDPLPPTVPPALAGLCLRLLAKDPGSRPQTSVIAAVLRKIGPLIDKHAAQDASQDAAHAPASAAVSDRFYSSARPTSAIGRPQADAPRLDRPEPGQVEPGFSAPDLRMPDHPEPDLPEPERLEPDRLEAGAPGPSSPRPLRRILLPAGVILAVVVTAVCVWLTVGVAPTSAASPSRTPSSPASAHS
jgi:serine/threonine protein kinase